MNLENAKEFYKDLIYRNMEASEEHNIFTNYNNFSRDHFVMEKTFEECWNIMQFLQRDAESSRNMRDMYAKKAYAKEPAIVAITKEENKKFMRWVIELSRAYEKKLKELGVNCREIMEEVSDKKAKSTIKGKEE
jgi:hypothetical protein